MQFVRIIMHPCVDTTIAGQRTQRLRVDIQPSYIVREAYETKCKKVGGLSYSLLGLQRGVEKEITSNSV